MSSETSQKEDIKEFHLIFTSIIMASLMQQTQQLLILLKFRHTIIIWISQQPDLSVSFFYSIYSNIRQSFYSSLLLSSSIFYIILFPLQPIGITIYPCRPTKISCILNYCRNYFCLFFQYLVLEISHPFLTCLSFKISSHGMMPTFCLSSLKSSFLKSKVYDWFCSDFL